MHVALLLLLGIIAAAVYGEERNITLVSSKLVSDHLRVLETATQELRQCEAGKRQYELVHHARIAALRERILELEYQLLNKECTPARIYPCPMNGNTKLLPQQQNSQGHKKHTDLRLFLQDFANLRDEDFLVIGFVVFTTIKFVLAVWSFCWPTRNPPLQQQQQQQQQRRISDTGTEVVEEEYEAPSTPALSSTSSPTIPSTPIQRPNFNDKPTTPRSRRTPTTPLDRPYSTPSSRRHTSIERNSQRREEIEQRRRLTTNNENML